MNALDRRVSVRQNSSTIKSVEIKLQRSQLPGQIRNISAHGACLEIGRRLSLGTRLELAFRYAPEDFPLPVLSKIIWRKPGQRATSGDNSTWSYGILFYQFG